MQIAAFFLMHFQEFSNKEKYLANGRKKGPEALLKLRWASRAY